MLLKLMRELLRHVKLGVFAEIPQRPRALQFLGKLEVELVFQGVNLVLKLLYNVNRH